MAADSVVNATAFRAMGSDAEVIVVGADRSVLGDAVGEIGRLEQLWSRFVAGSEVTALNRRAGHPVIVDPATLLLVERAVAAWRITGGGFDPTVLGDVLRAGYADSFDDPPGVEWANGSSDLVIACSDIEIDAPNRTVTVPRRSGFDPGGIGKGLAADIVATRAMAAGAAGVCVNLGGDLRVEGIAPGGEAWIVAVEHTRRPSPLALLSIAGGAVATSTTLRRRWTVAGDVRHHLIDPRTGLPSTSDVELITVVAGQAWLAEALATASLIRGSERMFDLVDNQTHALAVTDDGHLHTTAGLRPFLVTMSGRVA